jgi:hypothetical protein
MSVVSPVCIAFEGAKRLAQGSLAHVAVAVKRRAAQRGHGVLLVFDYATGGPIDLDLRGADKDVEARFSKSEAFEDGPEPPAPRGPGRPKLGVVAREVTLLPRHWEWLNAQPGGASVALRKLVEEARRVRGGRDVRRTSQEAAFRFMTAIAGNLPLYEEANRALFAGDGRRFVELTQGWPTDVRDHARRLAAPALGAAAPAA